jgi:glycosyltransferase involved in cell wall biosynthesis
MAMTSIVDDLSMPQRGSICLVSHDPGVQGAERAMLDMAIFLREAGWDVTVLVPFEKGGLADLVDVAHLKRATIPYYYWIGPGRLKGRIARAVFNILILPRLVRYFRASDFDAVYTHSTAVGVTAVAARLAGVPHVWHMHEFGPYERGDVRVEWDLGERISLALMRWTRSTYVAVANVIRETFRPFLGNADIRVIYQPVPFLPELSEKDSAAIEIVQAISGPKIIYVGAVCETKRQIDSVRALPKILDRHSDARLVLAGRVEPDYGSRVKAMAEKLGVAHAVVFLGYLHNAPAVIGLCDISVNCRLAEASPRVLVESMMARTVVLAADAGGNVESVTPETGILFRARDPDDLADKVNWVIDHPGQAKEMEAAAYRKAVEERDVGRYKDRYVALIEDAIAHAQTVTSRQSRGRQT